jgi:hypothetical protein
MATIEVLDERALGRATLARQMLLERRAMVAGAAVEHLVGMQAQAADSPYVGLWTRLEGFEAGELVAAIEARDAVRIHVMRATVHLVSRRDALWLRPLLQPVLTRSYSGQAFAKDMAGVDTDAVLAMAHELVEEKPRTRAELGRLLNERWPDRDPSTLSYTASYLLPMVQIPPRGLWGRRGPAAWALAESWLGQPFATEPSVDELVLRYLAAFGPASVRDIQQWSGLTKLREVVDRLGPKLQAFTGDDGRELVDLPDAPRPDPETPAPPRFLPEYDNLLLSHADRRRVIPDGRRVPLPPGAGGRCGTLLVDGVYRADWAVMVAEGEGTATLTIEPFASLDDHREAIAVEGHRLLDFIAPGATQTIAGL